MATFRELIYSVLDIMKERSDDAYYTEEHVLFLATKIRALLLERKYKNTRNSTFQEMSPENMQQICLNLEPTEQLPYGCGGNWLHSIEKVPAILNVSEPKVYFGGDMLQSIVCYIPAQRMPYVGHNKWLRNIVYASRSQDGHLYLNGLDPKFLYLTQAKMEAAFADPEEAAKWSCDPDVNGCDIMDMTFPLEQALVPSCIEMTVQELLGSRYAPEDKQNDAKDGLGEAAVAASRHPRPAENSTYKQKEQEAE